MKCRWVFRLKKNETGEICRYKARLVTKGFTQQQHIDFFETFSSVSKIQTMRLMFLLAAQPDLHIEQLGIPNAYVKARVAEDIYMAQPEDFIDNEHPTHVLKLKKTLYGIKQAGRNWNRELK